MEKTLLYASLLLELNLSWCEQSVGTKTIRVVLSGRVIGEGVAQDVGNIGYCCDFIIIYREMVNALSLIHI